MSKQTQITIGIVGYGRFGKVLHKALQKGWKDAFVMVFSKSKPKDNKTFFDFKELEKCNLAVPCVPISAFKQTLKEIKPLLADKVTVMDVCSVKIMPVKWMREVLGRKASIIASHPVFGPDSSRQGTDFSGLNLMIANVSADKGLYLQVKNFWKSLGVNIIEITPEEHDRYSAYTMNYNHLIGRIGQLVGIKPTPIDTTGFKVIYDALTYVINDSWELFVDMQRYNPYSKEMRDKVKQALLTIETKINSQSS